MPPLCTSPCADHLALSGIDPWEGRSKGTLAIVNSPEEVKFAALDGWDVVIPKSKATGTDSEEPSKVLVISFYTCCESSTRGGGHTCGHTTTGAQDKYSCDRNYAVVSTVFYLTAISAHLLALRHHKFVGKYRSCVNNVRLLPGCG